MNIGIVVHSIIWMNRQFAFDHIAVCVRAEKRQKIKRRSLLKLAFQVVSEVIFCSSEISEKLEFEWNEIKKKNKLPAESRVLIMLWLYSVQKSTISTKKGGLLMTLTCIWSSGSNSGDILECMEHPFIAITPRTTLNWNCSTCKGHI